MKKTILLITSILITFNLFSQIQYTQTNIVNQNFIKNLSGPRIGFTIISNGDLKDELVSEFGLTSSIITQFGYQFEKQIMGDENVAGFSRRYYFLGRSRTWIIFTEFKWNVWSKIFIWI